MTFTMNRASFDLDTTGTVTLKNQPYESKKLLKDPIETNSEGQDPGSKQD